MFFLSAPGRLLYLFFPYFHLSRRSGLRRFLERAGRRFLPPRDPLRLFYFLGLFFTGLSVGGPALKAGLGHCVCKKVYCPYGIVISRNYIVHLVRVAVRVNDSDNGNSYLSCLPYGYCLLF